MHVRLSLARGSRIRPKRRLTEESVLTVNKQVDLLVSTLGQLTIAQMYIYKSAHMRGKDKIMNVMYGNDNLYTS